MTPEDQEQVREIVAAAEQRIKDHAAEIARDLQTEILQGLGGFARGNFARLHALESVQGDLSIRIAALEERVLYLETRRAPPQ
ncbi:MAG: hypothetical protein P4L56_09130 [Candidatus Sulfopaludibacter sp.]|nr:hypothetical protein [Candidatus Sulfopaludibacter sp.]